MASKIALGVPCDHCGRDEYWDNRESKTNPKAPDYKCANKECKDPKSGYPFGRWEKDRSKWGKGAAPAKAPVKAEPQGGRITGDDTTPDERGEKVFSWPALTYTYGKLYKAVHGTMESVLGGDEGTVVVIDQQAIQAAVATLLIQGEKAHIPLLHPRPKVEKVAPKQVAKESYAEMPEGLDREDFEESLPF